MADKIALTRARLLVVAVLSVVSCILMSFVAARIVRGCYIVDCVGFRPFHVLDLGLEGVQVFPENTVLDPMRRLTDGEGAIEDGIQAAYFDRGSLIYQVQRYGGLLEAKNAIEREIRLVASSIRRNQGVSAISLDTKGLAAEDVAVVCSSLSNPKQCTAVMRYHEYVVFINGYLTKEFDQSDFLAVVIFVDQQIDSRLK